MDDDGSMQRLPERRLGRPCPLAGAEEAKVSGLMTFGVGLPSATVATMVSRWRSK